MKYVSKQLTCSYGGRGFTVWEYLAGNAMTDTTISELRELLGKATEGPWSIGPIPHMIDGPGGLQMGCATSHNAHDDAALIVAMRNALPGLLDRLEELDGIYHE